MNKQKPVIGSRYQPQWYERRSSDGSYQALNPVMGPDELRVQRWLRPRAVDVDKCVAVAAAAIGIASYITLLILEGV